MFVDVGLLNHLASPSKGNSIRGLFVKVWGREKDRNSKEMVLAQTQLGQGYFGSQEFLISPNKIKKIRLEDDLHGAGRRSLIVKIRRNSHF